MTVPVLVAVDAPLSVGDAALTYAAPGAVPPGSAVIVPLRTRLVAGYALGPAEAEGRVLRPVLTLLPEIPPLPADLLTLARWLAEHYVCAVGEALAAMLPPGLMKHLRLRVSVSPGAAVPRRLRALHGRTPELDALRQAVGAGAAARLGGWLAEGTLRLAAALPAPAVRGTPPRRPLRLRVHRALWTPAGNGARTVLLLGEEREGTYVAAVGEALARGHQALAVFAAVWRAERLAARLGEILGAEVAVLHGDLPEAERLARWLAVRRGEVAVVAGTRAAVFAPLTRLGLVIVDDEADIGHREERVPRYHVREVARRRAATLLLADQVPAAETYILTRRPGVEVLRPRTGGGSKVVIVDLRRTAGAARPEPVLSTPLVETLTRVLHEGGRALLFAHRKGYAAVLVCAECGYAPHCERCEVPLAFDQQGRLLRCRYCRDLHPSPSDCPRCGGRVFVPRGAGTQRAARLARALRLAPVLRLDSDVARTPEDVQRLLRRFRRQGGILVATPLLLEASDAPRVDLAGVILADAGLRHPDFRAPAAGLRVLWQVRALARTWCVVQTYAPDHPALRALRRSDLREFYRDDLRVRRAFSYPPYGEVLTVEVTGGERAAAAAARSLAGTAGPSVEVLGPVPLRRGRQSRWQVLFRGPAPVPREGLAAWLRRTPSGVRVAVDVDP